MKTSFWILAALLRLGLTSPHAFSVQDDLFAFPQYEVIFSESYIAGREANKKLSRQAHSQFLQTQDPLSSSDLQPHGDPPAQDPFAEPSETDHQLSETYEPMRFGDRRYLCTIPIVPPSDATNASADASSASEENELIRASDRGWELLDDMRGSCLYYLSGYWSYSFCYDSGVKQFHQLPPTKGVPPFPPTEDPNVDSFTLGAFDGRKTAPGKEIAGGGRREGEVAVQTSGETKYLVQKMGGGTMCPLIGRERKIEIQFHCNPQSADRIGLIKEISTCSYLMVIHTPRLCSDVAFLPPQRDKPHPIVCQEVVAESDIPAWEASKTSEAERLLLQPPEEEAAIGDGEDAEHDQQFDLPVVGGITVGLQKDVGSPGKVIEPGAVVGGARETYISTVASSDGKVMGEKELRKLNVGDSKDVEELMDRLREIAGRKGWKLEVVDTPRGRQFRGVVEGDEGDGEEGEGAATDEGRKKKGGSEEKYKKEH